MAEAVFEAKADAVKLLEEDDVVGRASLVVRDGAKWGVEGKVVLVRGSDEAIRRAREIVEEAGGRASAKAEDVRRDLDSEGDEAAGGVGFLFG